MIKKILISALVVVVILAGIYFLFPGVVVSTSMFFERNAAGLSIKSVMVDEHKIIYLEGGNGENILLIHGYGQNKDNWNRMAKYLTQSYHVICIDMPGSGESSKIESFKYTIKNQTQVLDKFCEKIGLDKFNLVGNSMGGAIAACHALLAPQKVLSIALFNSGSVPGAEKSDFTKIVEGKGKNPFIIETSMDFDEFLKYVFVKTPPIPGPVKQYFVDQAKQNRAFSAKIGQDLNDDKYFINIAALNKSKIKTLILWGDKDRLCHVSGAYILNKGIAGSKIVIMKDCGHAPMIERPQEAADNYLNFLNEN